MDTAQFLADLRAQRDRIDQAIFALEALNGTKPLGNGHDLPTPLGKPVTALVPVKQAVTTGRRTMSPAARRKIAAAQKARWAAKKKPAKPVAATKPVVSKKAATTTAKRVVSSESRKKMAEAQQKRWAKKKRAAKSAAKKAAAPAATSTVKEAPKA